MDYKELLIPRINVNDDGVTIGSIRFQNMDYIKEGEVLYSVETSKAVEDYEVDFSGYVVLFVEDGDEVKVGDSAGRIYKDKAAAQKMADEIAGRKTVQVKVNASKKAIEYAGKIGFDLSRIRKEGIIKVQDIEDFINAGHGHQ